MQSFRGILPALAVPFRADNSIDEPELAALAAWLAGQDGITGIVTNGIAGEVFALSPEERVRVTQVVVEAAGGTPVLSGIYGERLDETAEQARALEKVGAAGLLVMPAGRWLRYGTDTHQVLRHFRNLSQSSSLPLVAHLYPSATKAAYSLDTLRALAAEPSVVSFKVGTRDMAQYEENLRVIREQDPSCTLLTCQDEFLLASMVQDVDGAIVGFASFVPELVTQLWAAIEDKDLARAQSVYETIYPLNKLVYGHDHPSYENYPRMKTAMTIAGRLAADYVRPPVARTSPAARAAIAQIVERAQLAPRP